MAKSNLANVNTGGNIFETYLLSEYSNIAQAHFKSIETISTFFRYYLLMMSIPISAVAILFQITPEKSEIIDIILKYHFPISILLFSISIVGLGVFCYITNLRLDTILYARVVNGIRKYFYDSADIDLNLKLRMRVLPQSPQLPPYFEKSFFLPVVLVFAVINTLYLSSGWYILFKYNQNLLDFLDIHNQFLSHIYVFSHFSILPLIFVISHFIIYWWYTNHREIAYIKSNILGVDIDGVLNEHRQHFCSLLSNKTNKELDPNAITHIPVHENPNLEVDREDERQVFNDPKYWKDMPDVEGAAETLRKLRNIFQFKIYIFTYRPWPDTQSEVFEHIIIFLDECARSFKKVFFVLFFKISHPITKLLLLFKEKPLKQITKEWLKRHEFKYDKLIFEKGNDYSSDPRGKFHNRFYMARKKKIRFFVEDDLEKAIKLSYICDIVFLFDQPYNQERTGMPTNIIPVKSWDEIYKEMRIVS